MQRGLGFGQGRPVPGSGLIDGGQRQQNAAIRVVGEAGFGFGGELAGGRHPAFVLRVASLVEGDEAADEGDDEGDGDGGEL